MVYFWGGLHQKNAGKNQFQDLLWRTRISTPPKNWNLSLEEDDVNRLWFDHKKRQINIRHMTFLRPLKCIVKSKSVWTAGLKRAVSIVRTIMQNLQNFHYYCKSPVFAYTSCLVNIGREVSIDWKLIHKMVWNKRIGNRLVLRLFL